MKVVALTGAGLSTDSGIPDFRSEGGIWERFDPDDFHIERFRADPVEFWLKRAELIAASKYLDAEPNASHFILSQAVRRGDLAGIITQNVDGLHAKSGVPQASLIEVHGNGAQAVCPQCEAREPIGDVLARVTEQDAPSCREGCGPMKPDVVLFGEPVDRLGEAWAMLADADVVVAIGTSLQVHPVAGLVEAAVAHGARLIIANAQPTPYDDLAEARHQSPLPAPLQRIWPEAAEAAGYPLP